jgi:hypothetical protein
MLLAAISSTFSAEAAVLLVLLAVASAPGERVAVVAELDALQQQLGLAIRILVVDEASHPAVVRSFDGQGLPAFVLTRHGVELWHQQGLPTGEGMAARLLSKLAGASF